MSLPICLSCRSQIAGKTFPVVGVVYEGSVTSYQSAAHSKIAGKTFPVVGVVCEGSVTSYLSVCLFSDCWVSIIRCGGLFKRVASLPICLSARSQIAGKTFPVVGVVCEGSFTSYLSVCLFSDCWVSILPCGGLFKRVLSLPICLSARSQIAGKTFHVVGVVSEGSVTSYLSVCSFSDCLVNIPICGGWLRG